MKRLTTQPLRIRATADDIGMSRKDSPLDMHPMISEAGQRIRDELVQEYTDCDGCKNLDVSVTEGPINHFKLERSCLVEARCKVRACPHDLPKPTYALEIDKGGVIGGFGLAAATKTAEVTLKVDRLMIGDATVDPSKLTNANIGRRPVTGDTYFDSRAGITFTFDGEQWVPHEGVRLDDQGKTISNHMKSEQPRGADIPLSGVQDAW